MQKQTSEDTHLPKEPNSYWLKSVEIPHYPTLEEDLKVDVAIIGGGITGITTAYKLIKEGLNVAVFEADTIFKGTTGHTTAKVTAQHGLIYAEFIQHFGLKKAKQYFEANQMAVREIEELITTHQIDCQFKREDAYIYTEKDHYVQQIKQEYEAYQKLDIIGELLKETPLPFPIKAAITMKDQAQFHPLQYLKFLADSFKHQNGQIYEQCVATEIKNENPAIICFENGREVIAEHVVQTSHFPFHDDRGYFARLHPERSYVLAGKPKEKLFDGMYINAEQPTRSIRTVMINGEELLLFSGEGHKTGQGVPEKDHYEALWNFAREKFDVKEILYKWSAQDLITLDNMPYIGKVEKHYHSYIATGFRKWGMTTSHVAATLITDLIMDRENPNKELFTPNRFKADPSLKKVIKENFNVAGELISGKLTLPDKELKDVKFGEGTAIHIKGKRAGAYINEDGQLFVVDTTCTHMGCEVKWNSGDHTWDCPCHGSRFSYKGEVLEGPAEKPLEIIDPEQIDYGTT